MKFPLEIIDTIYTYSDIDTRLALNKFFPGFRFSRVSVDTKPLEAVWRPFRTEFNSEYDFDQIIWPNLKGNTKPYTYTIIFELTHWRDSKYRSEIIYLLKNPPDGVYGCLEHHFIDWPQ